MQAVLSSFAAASACSGPQSTLDAAGPSAAAIARLGTVMYVVATLVTVLVIALALIPFVRARRGPVDRRLFLWGGGVALPLLTLTALVPYAFTVGRETRPPPSAKRLVINVTGHQYWWQLVYRREGGAQFVTANELRLPAGEPVELLLRSADVIHSFWAPTLAGKTDLIPGRVTRQVIQADRPGAYRGQCAEYCGMQHALMAFDVVVLPRAEFDAWAARMSAPVREPPAADLAAGRDLFLRLGCGGCHTVRGVSEGTRGPDLTDVGARRMVGAGALAGGVGNLGGWIASAQHLKPGNAMPSYTTLQGTDLRALASYLESLK